MPELPEVEIIRRQLAPWLTGATIHSTRLLDAPPGPKYRGLTESAGQEILSVERRGKFLILPLKSEDELIIHLGMTGVITKDPDESHLRVHLRLQGRDDLYFKDTRRFGRFLLLHPGERHLLPSLAHMGPEPLSPTFTPELLAAGLARSKSPIKTRLLNQRAVAGLGNIYVDEALFMVGVNPQRPSHALTDQEITQLHQAIQEVLRAGLRDGGTTLRDYRQVDGGKGEHAKALQVYGRANAPCVRCQRPLSFMTVGGRGTSYCPTCQP